MDLFLNNSQESLFLEILGLYLRLPNEKKLQIITLNEETLSFIENNTENQIKFQTLPILIVNSKEYHTSVFGIANALLFYSYTENLLGTESITEVFLSFSLIKSFIYCYF